MGTFDVAFSARTDSLTPGAQLGRYRVHDRIARGGMGEVWLATAHGPNGFRKTVVIKTIIPSLADSPSYVQMLINEASLAARLNHPNIVQVFDLECVDGTYFITMEYLPGRTLAQVLQRLDRRGERMPVWLAQMVAATCCDGLQYAHDFADDDGRPLGLLHRDISPSNIMLSFAGNVTVLDFGIATAKTSPETTRSGALKGKYHYMAPERVSGLPADRRSDVYSLGVVLYQLLTWRRPFAADADLELLSRIVEGKPAPPRRYAPWLDEALEACVLRALAVDPAARYQQARDLAAELRAQVRRSGVIRDANDVTDFMRELFADAPELGVGRARRPAQGSTRAPSESDLSLVRDLPGGLTEPVSEAEIIIEEDDAEYVSAAGTSAEAGDGAVLTPMSGPALAHGSEEPPSLYDVAPRQLPSRHEIPPGDIFSPQRRPSSTDDCFTVNHPPRRRDRRSQDESGPAFVPAPRVAATEQWPWPASLKKKD